MLKIIVQIHGRITYLNVVIPVENVEKFQKRVIRSPRGVMYVTGCAVPVRATAHYYNTIGVSPWHKVNT